MTDQKRQTLPISDAVDYEYSDFDPLTDTYNLSDFWKLTLTDDTESEMMYAAGDVLSIISHDYYTWYITIPRYYTENHRETLYTIPAAAEYLRNLWTHYCNVHLDNLRRAYQALQAEYDPISNYDMKEEGADGRRKDQQSTSNTTTGTSTTTSSAYKTGFGSVAETLTDKVTNSQTAYPSVTVTETPTNTQSISYDGDTKTGYHEGTEHFLKRSGNIGVTTSQQMIESEIQLRKADLLRDYVTAFMRSVAFYRG